MTNNRIKAIFYDLDGTLRMNVPAGRDAFADFANELGVPVDQEDRLRAIRWEHYYWAESPEIIGDRLDYPELVPFWVNYGRRQLVVLGADPVQAEELAPLVHKRMSENFHPQDVIPTDLHVTLCMLKEQDYILGVLSNRDQPYNEYLSQIGLGGLFKIMAYAGEIGVYKPAPAIFEYALSNIGIVAEQAVYIGDNYYADIVGARGAGMQPVLFDTGGVFDEPDCPVIQAHSQILPLLERM